MKKRIKIDVTLQLIGVALTFGFYKFPQLYFHELWCDDLADLLGLVLIIKGTMIRMLARGHKKFHSQQSRSLVTTGIYQYVRNPMYLGSFFLGLGYCLIVWPWISWPLFAIAFYLRFNQQIQKEEEFLRNSFGRTFEDYCQRVPRLFLSFSNLEKIKSRELFIMQEAFATQEATGLWAWPVLAFALELFQEKLIFGIMDIPREFLVFLITALLFSAVFVVQYNRSVSNG